MNGGLMTLASTLFKGVELKIVSGHVIMQAEQELQGRQSWASLSASCWWGSERPAVCYGSPLGPERLRNSPAALSALCSRWRWKGRVREGEGGTAGRLESKITPLEIKTKGNISVTIVLLYCYTVVLLYYCHTRHTQFEVLWDWTRSFLDSDQSNLCFPFLLTVCQAEPSDNGLLGWRLSCLC